MFNHNRPQKLFKNGHSTFVSIMTNHLKTEVDRIRETSCVSLSDILRIVDSVQLQCLGEIYVKQEETLKCRLCFRCVFLIEKCEQCCCNLWPNVCMCIGCDAETIFVPHRIEWLTIFKPFVTHNFTLQDHVRL